MPKAKQLVQDEKIGLLLEKLLVLQLHSLGVTQANIAKMVGRQKLWVNAFLKGLPKN